MWLQCQIPVLNVAKASDNEVHVFTLMRAGLPYMGMSLHTHRAVPAPSLALLSASEITVSTLFEMAPVKCFCR